MSHRGRSYRNEAWARERIRLQETAQNPIGTAVEHLLGFARGRSVSVSIHRQRLHGLVSARQRGGRLAWEIDYLVDSTRTHDSVPGLLESAIASAGRAGAEKLYLRLEASSPLLPVVLETGFQPYQEATLFVRSSGMPPAEVDGLRPFAAMDSYLVFRLYNECTPDSVRRMEAANFTEWQAAQDRRWMRHGVRFALERNGVLAAAMSAAPHSSGISMDLLCSDDAADAVVPMVSTAVSALEADFARIEALVPASAGAVASQLSDAGFQQHRDYVSLMRRTTRPVSVPSMRPALANNAVGVKA